MTQRTAQAAPKADRTPPGFSPRCFEVLEAVAFLGPAPFAAIELLAGVRRPSLGAMKARRRLVYRELERLQARHYVGWRRLPLEAAGVYYLAPRGVDLVRALGVAEVPEDALKRFMAFPEHEALLRSFRLELLVARFRGLGAIRGLSWNDRPRFPLNVAGRETSYEPDGLYRFKLEQDEVREVLVELDRGTETLERWRAKIAKAAAVLRERKGPSRLLVLGQSPKRLRSLIREAAKVMGEGAAVLRGIETSLVAAETILTEAVCATAEGRQIPLLA